MLLNTWQNENQGKILSASATKRAQGKQPDPEIGSGGALGSLPADSIVKSGSQSQI